MIAYFCFCALLFCVGILGAVLQTNALLRLLCVQISISACAVLAVCVGRYFTHIDGEVFALCLIIISVCQVALFCALARPRRPLE